METFLQIPLGNLPWRKRFTREHSEHNLQVDLEKNKSLSHMDNTNVGMVASVIRHTSAPTHTIAYYFDQPVNEKQ